MAVSFCLGLEGEPFGEQPEEQLAQRLAVVEDRGADIAELGLRLGLDLGHDVGHQLRRAARDLQLLLQVLDPRLPLLQLGQQLRDVIGHRDGAREPPLLRAGLPELVLHGRRVRGCRGELRLDLRADLGDRLVDDLRRDQLVLKMRHDRRLDVVDFLVKRHRARRVTAVVVDRASVRRDPHTLGPQDAASADRAAARPTSRDPRERIRRVPPAGRALNDSRAVVELRLHREPRVVVDDAPLRDLHAHDLGGIGLHAADLATVADLLDAAVQVQPAIPRIPQHLANPRRRPGPAAPPANRRGLHALVVEHDRDRLQPLACQVRPVDSLDHLGLLRVDHRDREPAPRRVRLSLQRIAVAATARDTSLANPRPQRLARPRPDRLQLHLVTGALNERGRLIDRVGEQHFLAGRVVEDAAAVVANQVANHQRHLDGVAPEPRLVTADDDVAGLHVRHQPPNPGSAVKVVASLAVVDILQRLVGPDVETPGKLLTPAPLDVEAELLLAFVVLGSSEIDSNRHLWSPEVLQA